VKSSTGGTELPSEGFRVINHRENERKVNHQSALKTY
jgi:hypothetical protein